MKTLLILAAAFCFTLNACDGVIDPPAPNTQILPLKVGNWWQYTSELSSNSNAYLEWKVTGKKEFNNKQYYVLAKASHGSTGAVDSDTTFLRYESEDLMQYSVADGAESVLFDAPFKVVPYDSIMPFKGHFLLSNTEREETPAGVFENCMDFVDNYPYHTDPSHDVMATGVGYVRMWGFRWTYRLKAYHIN